MFIPSVCTLCTWNSCDSPVWIRKYAYRVHRWQNGRCVFITIQSRFDSAPLPTTTTANLFSIFSSCSFVRIFFCCFWWEMVDVKPFVKSFRIVDMQLCTFAQSISSTSGNACHWLTSVLVHSQHVCECVQCSNAFDQLQIPKSNTHTRCAVQHCGILCKFIVSAHTVCTENIFANVNVKRFNNKSKVAENERANEAKGRNRGKKWRS